MTHATHSNARGLLVTGTDTGIGKTVVSAMLVDAIDGAYFKPVQAGLDEETDTEFVQRVTGLTPNRIIAEAYRLNTPASPHLAAAIDGVEIDTSRLTLPQTSCPLVVEGAGGVMVPLTAQVPYIEMFRRWQLPTIVCARTSLGTINHTLLTIESLRRWSIDVHGVVFVGDPHQENEAIIPKMGEVARLGRLPFLESLDIESLRTAFAQNFDIEQFTRVLT
ncbi:MAG: dethiobiotin synthase [Acidiferrobacterales bacterium]|nr:dethiobiotin synthase [Acidiferrobacterales bacterium]